MNKTDAGNGSHGIFRVIDASRALPPDPKRSDKKSAPMNKPVVILDKSYAQSAKPGDLRTLANDYTVVVSSSFYFECFSPLSENRKKIFSKFPEFRRVHSPHLFQQERDSQTPAESMDLVLLNVNPAIISGGRVLTPAEQRCLDDFESNVVNPRVALWKEFIDQGVVGFENSEIHSVAGNLQGFKSLCKRLLDRQFVRDTAAVIGISCASSLDDSWYTYRWLQARLIHGLTLKYLACNADWKPSVDELEHDVHDIDYLSLGLHARCFACNESSKNYRRLGWKFKFLCPDGKLIQTA